MSAAWLHGVAWALATDPVEIILPAGRRVRKRNELRVRSDRLRQNEVLCGPMGLVTSPARTAFDLARRGGPRDAVPIVDALLRATRTPLADVWDLVEGQRGARGVRVARANLGFADPRSESPRESLLRLVITLAGLPAPVPQFEVRDRGRFVARLDLAWPGLGRRSEPSATANTTGRVSNTAGTSNATTHCVPPGGWSSRSTPSSSPDRRGGSANCVGCSPTLDRECDVCRRLDLPQGFIRRQTSHSAQTSPPSRRAAAQETQPRSRSWARSARTTPSRASSTRRRRAGSASSVSASHRSVRSRSSEPASRVG